MEGLEAMMVGADALEKPADGGLKDEAAHMNDGEDLIQRPKSLDSVLTLNGGRTGQMNPDPTDPLPLQRRLATPPFPARLQPTPPVPPDDPAPRFLRTNKLKPIGAGAGEDEADAVAGIGELVLEEPRTGEADGGSTLRRKRHAWWGPQADRNEEAVKVKSMLRATLIDMEPGQTEPHAPIGEVPPLPISAPEKPCLPSHGPLSVLPHIDNTESWDPPQSGQQPHTVSNPEPPPAEKLCRRKKKLQAVPLPAELAWKNGEGSHTGGVIEPPAPRAGEDTGSATLESPKSVETAVVVSPQTTAGELETDKLRKKENEASKQDPEAKPSLFQNSPKAGIVKVSKTAAFKSILRFCLDNDLVETAKMLQTEGPEVLKLGQGPQKTDEGLREYVRSRLHVRDFQAALARLRTIAFAEMDKSFRPGKSWPSELWLTQKGFFSVQYNLMKAMAFEAGGATSLEVPRFLKSQKDQLDIFYEAFREDLEIYQRKHATSSGCLTVTPTMDFGSWCTPVLSNAPGPTEAFDEACRLYDAVEWYDPPAEVPLEYALECVRFRDTAQARIGQRKWVHRKRAAKAEEEAVGESGKLKSRHEPPQESQPALQSPQQHHSVAHPLPHHPVQHPQPFSVGPLVAHKPPPLAEPPPPVEQRVKLRTVVSRGSVGGTPSNHGQQERGEFDRVSTGSSTILGPTSDAIEKLMPPAPSENETADFALLTQCGPVTGHIRALAVQDMDASSVIIASSGGEDRSDRKISIWDARSGSLESQLDNGTQKPVTGLAFHPTRKNLLISTDMEFDVKLWDWQTGELLRCWKKLHRRIIWRVAFVPRRDDMAATCSGDQSLKIWNLDAPNEPVQSAHANEPFTSFLFCGDPSSQTVIASLAYALRIYKVRTMSLLHTIHFKDLKESKTPISALAIHPEHENYILISCDNQLRLFDLSSETHLRTYTARELGVGVCFDFRENDALTVSTQVRIEGNFSPCGTFVYCGSWDLRAYNTSAASRKASLPSVRTADRIFPNANAGGDGAEEKPKERGSPEATGVYIWRVATGRLERAEMRAMEDVKSPVVLCRWIRWSEKSRKGKRRKALIAATIDRFIKTYL
ncbi:protein with putative role during mitosis [Phlyctochytrium bullatum]|nr:protein with putative role during mitosis [Phlyctochytrium bullatum]